MRVIDYCFCFITVDSLRVSRSTHSQGFELCLDDVNNCLNDHFGFESLLKLILKLEISSTVKGILNKSEVTAKDIEKIHNKFGDDVTGQSYKIP